MKQMAPRLARPTPPLLLLWHYGGPEPSHGSSFFSLFGRGKHGQPSNRPKCSMKAGQNFVSKSFCALSYSSRNPRECTSRIVESAEHRAGAEP